MQDELAIHFCGHVDHCSQHVPMHRHQHHDQFKLQHAAIHCREHLALQPPLRRQLHHQGLQEIEIF